MKHDKPCKKLGYCPYGCLVEYFPLDGQEVQWNGISLDWIHPKTHADLKKLKPLVGTISCKVWGHDCPVFYVAEGTVE